MKVMYKCDIGKGDNLFSAKCNLKFHQERNFISSFLLLRAQRVQARERGYR